MSRKICPIMSKAGTTRVVEAPCYRKNCEWWIDGDCAMTHITKLVIHTLKEIEFSTYSVGGDRIGPIEDESQLDKIADDASKWRKD